MKCHYQTFKTNFKPTFYGKTLVPSVKDTAFWKPYGCVPDNAR